MAQFVIGNKEAEKWDESDAINLFVSIRELCKDAKVNSLQDAILKSGHYSSGFYYLIEKFPVLESIKKDCLDIIIAGVNQKTLEGTFPAAPAIWRMKQCGEKDESAIDHRNNGGKFEPPLQMSDELMDKLIDKL